MKTIRIMAIAVLIVGSGLALLVARGQQSAGIERTDPATASTAGSTHGAPLRETVTLVADVPIPNLPGKRLVSLVIDYPPGGPRPRTVTPARLSSTPTSSGQIRSQVDDEPARVYRSGEKWFESPGAHHPVSANASDTEPARLLAVVIVDTADEQLTIPDRR